MHHSAMGGDEQSKGDATYGSTDNIWANSASFSQYCYKLKILLKSELIFYIHI